MNYAFLIWSLYCFDDDPLQEDGLKRSLFKMAGLLEWDLLEILFKLVKPLLVFRHHLGIWVYSINIIVVALLGCKGWLLPLSLKQSHKDEMMPGEWC